MDIYTQPLKMNIASNCVQDSKESQQWEVLRWPEAFLSWEQGWAQIERRDRAVKVGPGSDLDTQETWLVGFAGKEGIECMDCN